MSGWWLFAAGYLTGVVVCVALMWAAEGQP